MNTRSLFAFLVVLLGLLTGAMAQPAFPTNTVVTLVTNTAHSVTLAWDRAASHTNLQSFGVLVGVKSGVYNVRINVPTNGTTYTVTNLPTGATYYFAVVARNVAGLDSDPSNEVNQTLERPAPVPGVRTVHLDTFLEAAPYPDGPWTNYVKLPRTSLMASMDRRFFRVRVEAQPGPTLLP